MELTKRVREANGNSFEASGVDAAVRSRCSGWNSGEMTRNWLTMK